MPFLRTLRKILLILNSELTPSQVALGFCLGIFAGLVPWGWNTLFLLTLAFIINCSFSATLLAFALFKILAWVLLPISYSVGKLILDGWSLLDPLWQLLAQGPLLAWLRLDHYAILGGYALALLIALPTYWAMRAFVLAYRESFFAHLERSRPWRALSRRERIFRLVQWLIMGGGVRFRTAKKPFWLFRYVRKEALVAVPLAYLALYGIVALIIPFLVDEVIARGATLILGGEVSVERANANALTGRLVLEGLTVQNPKRPEEVFRVREVVVDLSIFGILSRRVTFDEIAVGEVFLNIRREADGSLNVDDLDGGLDLAPYFEWLKDNAYKVDWVQLLSKYGEVVWKRIVSLLEPQPPPPQAGLLEDFKVLEPLWPAFALEKLRIRRLHISLEDEFKDERIPPITAVDVVVEGFAWRPELSSEPITLGVRAYLGGEESFIKLTATFDKQGEAPVHTFRIEAHKIELAPLMSLYEHTLPVALRGGTATLTCEITIEGGEVRAESSLLLEDLVVEGREGLSLFGLDPGTSLQVIAGINAYAERCPVALSFVVDGPLDAPRFHWDEALLKIAKRGLMMSGSGLLSGALSQIEARLSELEKLGLKEGTLEQALEELLERSLPPEDECALR